MLIKKLFLNFSILILFASVVSCASETSTEPKEEVKEEVIRITINTNNSVTKVIRGEKLQLAVNIETKGGASEDVEWSSGDESIATVNTNGLVTGVTAGTVMITVTSTADNSKTASVSIEVVPAVGEVWTQVSATGHFSARSGHQAFLGEGGRLWVIGGGDNNFNNLDDIWYSDDKGATWTKVTVSSGTTQFSGRQYHQAFLGENGRLWVIGGFGGSNLLNDIWYSDNAGVNWNQVTVSGTHFSARNFHQAFLGEGGRLWVIGGHDDSSRLNDIWYSDNKGMNWTQVNLSGNYFSARNGHQAFLGKNGRLWVMGGHDSSGLNDIWYSDNEGATWTQVTPSGGHFSGRYLHQAFLGEGGRLWVIGGTTDGNNRLNDIWYSDNAGVNWNQVTVSGTQFSARGGQQAFLGEGGKLWVIGGNDSSFTVLDDIWYSD